MQVSVDFLASECAALLHKMTHTELHVRANTYRSDDVRALAQVQDGLKALDQQIKTQTQEVRPQCIADKRYDLERSCLARGCLY